jgi:BarA-like signal transduction histidine kinase
LLRLLADLEKACGFLVTEQLKDEHFMFSGNSLHDNQINDLLKKEGIQACMKKPMGLYKLLTSITSR